MTGCGRTGLLVGWLGNSFGSGADPVGLPRIGVPAEPGALMMLGLQLQPVQFMNGGYQHGELLHRVVSEGDFPGSEDLLSGSGDRGIQASAAVGQFFPVVSSERILDMDSSFSAGPQLNARDRIVEAPRGHGLYSHTGDLVGPAV